MVVSDSQNQRPSSDANMREEPANTGNDSASIGQPVSQAETITVGKQEWEQLHAQAQEYLDGWKRAKADYANFKKETEARRDEFVQFSTQSAIMAFLPLYDHLVRALAQLD